MHGRGPDPNGSDSDLIMIEVGQPFEVGCKARVIESTMSTSHIRVYDLHCSKVLVEDGDGDK